MRRRIGYMAWLGDTLVYLLPQLDNEPASAKGPVDELYLTQFFRWAVAVLPSLHLGVRNERLGG